MCNKNSVLSRWWVQFSKSKPTNLVDSGNTQIPSDTVMAQVIPSLAVMEADSSTSKIVAISYNYPNNYPNLPLLPFPCFLHILRETTHYSRLFNGHLFQYIKGEELLA